MSKKSNDGGPKPAELSKPLDFPAEDDWDDLFSPEDLLEEAPAPADDTEEAAPTAVRYLGFRLGGELYAAPILRLSEVVRDQVATRVPRVKKYVRGIISVRGTIVPIIDLRQRLAESTDNEAALVEDVPEPADEGGESEATEESSRRVLISRKDAEVYGLLVDAVSDVFVLEPEDIEPPPATLPKRLLEFVEGIARVGGHIHTVLDLDAVTSFDAVAASAKRRGSEKGA